MQTVIISHAYVRCSYWLNIQTAHVANTTKATEEDAGPSSRPPRPPPSSSGGSGPLQPPALEFGLSPEGAVTVVSVPLLPIHAESGSESLKLELDPAALNVQDLLLQASAQNAATQLSKSLFNKASAVVAICVSQSDHQED